MDGVLTTSWRDGIRFDNCRGLGGVATRLSDGEQVATLKVGGVYKRVVPEEYYRALERAGFQREAITETVRNQHKE